MVGQALYPGCAGAEISSNETELSIWMMLSLPESTCERERERETQSDHHLPPKWDLDQGFSTSATLRCVDFNAQHSPASHAARRQSDSFRRECQFY